MKRIKKSDTVIVIAGKHKGKVSQVDKVSWDKLRLKGVNVMKKAVKGQWFVEKTLPLHESNVMYYIKDKQQAVKIWFVIDEKGKKQRQAKKLGTILD